MNGTRFQEIAKHYRDLRVAVVGDFCLDRYLEIDPTRSETSLETGLPVHNVTRVRAQPGAAGTVLVNLVALGVGRIDVVGFCGDDGEGYELQRALSALPGVRLQHFLCTPERRTFTYCKPLIVRPGEAPQELNRLDSKNWTPTPPQVVQHLVRGLRDLANLVDALIIMDQVEQAGTGVVSSQLLDVLQSVPRDVPVVADSRRGLSGYPSVIFKMNAAELMTLTGRQPLDRVEQIQQAAADLADRNQRPVIVTIAQRGLIAASPARQVVHVPAQPVQGPIDIVGAGDCVTASVTAALAAGATLVESLEIAAAAASVVIHQVGTTGSASIEQIARALASSGVAG